jgi:hypothetical protein
MAPHVAKNKFARQLTLHNPTLIDELHQLSKPGAGLTPHKLHTQLIVPHHLYYLTTLPLKIVAHPHQQRFQTEGLCHIVAPHILTKKHKSATGRLPPPPGNHPPCTSLLGTSTIKKERDPTVLPGLLSQLGREVKLEVPVLPTRQVQALLNRLGRLHDHLPQLPLQLPSAHATTIAHP